MPAIFGLFSVVHLTSLFISSAFAATGTITEFPAPTPGSGPSGIVAGPDGNLWFTEPFGHNIGRITPTGTFTEFPVPTPAGQPAIITAGPDGNLWFTENNTNEIDRITPAGMFTEFPVPTPNGGPFGVTAGPDGNLWFTEFSFANRIGRITPTGTFAEFPVPTPASNPEFIAAGPDGNLWFTENNANKVGRITPAGMFTEFPVPTPNSGPAGITAGPDGNVWFAECVGNKVGRITPTGTFAEFPSPTLGSCPFGITSGPDGNLWFTEFNGNKIGRLTPTGTFTEFPIPTPNSSPFGITAGPDGNLWFTEQVGNKIGRLTLGPGAPANLTLAPRTQTLAVDSQACVTATVTDSSHTAVPGVTVVFSVSGSDTTGGSVVTNTNGQATFCYTVARLPGADAIHAFADTNHNGVQDPGEPFDDAVVTIVLPTSTPGCEIIITNGGWIVASNGDQSTFGGNARIPQSGPPTGQEQYHDHGPAIPMMDVSSINVLAIVCSSNFQSANIFGTATINGSGSFDYRIDVKDLDSLGLTDRYRMTISNGYDSGDQPLGGGDVQIHPSR